MTQLSYRNDLVPQTISKRLIIHVNGARMAQFGLRGYFLKSGQANFFQIRYSSCVLSFRDTAVCLHFWAKFKMAARGPKRVTSQVF